ncbi:hypothetical protein GCM10027174_45210 [Salinifilum aidingensis]
MVFEMGENRGVAVVCRGSVVLLVVVRVVLVLVGLWGLLVRATPRVWGVVGGC